MLDIFQYGFIVRGFEAGIIIAIISPLIGIFLVLRRYSLIADTLSHISLAGIAIGLLLGLNPVLSAILVALISSTFIERLRISKKVYGESALALFLSGSLAVAVVIISLTHGFNVDLFNYLFGSIVTVRSTEVMLVGIIGILTIVLLTVFYRQLFFVTFDEEAAQVAGIPTRFINLLLIILAALTVSISIPIVGILLISALIVIPVITALQLHKSFKKTILLAEIFSLFSVIVGILISFYLNLSTGGTIVIISLLIFSVVYLNKNIRKK